MSDFGTRLKIIRIAFLKQTRPEFAKYADFSLGTMKTWECNQANPTEISLEKLVIKLQEGGMKISKEWLITGLGLSPLDDIASNKNNPIKNINDNVLDIYLTEGYPPFFNRNDTIRCVSAKKNDIKSKEIIIIKNESNYLLAQALWSEDEDLFYAEIIKNEPQELRKFNRKRHSLFKIIGFDTSQNVTYS